MRLNSFALAFRLLLAVNCLLFGVGNTWGQEATECDAACRADLARARAGTALYHDIGTALADGFTPIGGCVALPEGQAMGFHYRLVSRIDQTVDPAEPELIIYLPNEDGELELVAVEYIVPFTGSNPAPELFGQTFHYSAVRNRYELHAWLWRNNPDGIFADYNPKLRCPGT